MNEDMYELVYSRNIMLHNDANPINLYKLAIQYDSKINFFSGIAGGRIVDCGHEVESYYISQDGMIRYMWAVPDYFVSRNDMKRIMTFLRPREPGLNDITISIKVKARIGFILSQLNEQRIIFSELNTDDKAIIEGGEYYGKRFFIGEDERKLYIRAK